LPEANTIRLRAFREALGQAGCVEGQNVTIKYRWAEAKPQLAELAAQLVQDRVNLAAAKALGITVPLPLLGRGDEVIE
jgi:hypothetical protein